MAPPSNQPTSHGFAFSVFFFQEHRLWRTINPTFSLRRLFVLCKALRQVLLLLLLLAMCWLCWLCIWSVGPKYVSSRVVWGFICVHFSDCLLLNFGQFCSFGSPQNSSSTRTQTLQTRGAKTEESNKNNECQWKTRKRRLTVTRCW